MNLERLRYDLMRDEGFRAKPYRCTAGKLTIGIGRNIEDVGISEAEGAALLDFDMARVLAGLDNALPWWRKLSERRQRCTGSPSPSWRSSRSRSSSC